MCCSILCHLINIWKFYAFFLSLWKFYLKPPSLYIHTHIHLTIFPHSNKKKIRASSITPTKTKLNGSSDNHLPLSSPRSLLGLSFAGHVKKATRDEETWNAINPEGGGEKPHDSRGQIQIYGWSVSDIRS